ncbi:hypothetical protein NDU88_000550 [Pleurodeles waltl]|uniref:Uncharacterized protein n=1 Tax=Pleurodeles waltl TaxID=8319 RepID=A0AAV7VTU7_PLEWA|nr:hypothetical protein NDU88_000550 [Pleurodeles waltl]
MSKMALSDPPGRHPPRAPQGALKNSLRGPLGRGASATPGASKRRGEGRPNKARARPGPREQPLPLLAAPGASPRDPALVCPITEGRAPPTADAPVLPGHSATRHVVLNPILGVFITTHGVTASYIAAKVK